MIHLSRNECESLSYKATRGAGYPWGLAEEAAFAAGWLCARGIDGLTELLDCLTAHGAGQHTTHVQIDTKQWAGQGGATLCPLATGSAILDHATLAPGPFDTQTRVGPVGQPLLLVPFLWRAGLVKTQTARLHLDSGVISITGENPVPGLHHPITFHLSLTGEAPSRTDPTGCSAKIPDTTLQALDDLALQTTVPQSAQSRAGAGAGALDND